MHIWFMMLIFADRCGGIASPAPPHSRHSPDRHLPALHGCWPPRRPSSTHPPQRPHTCARRSKQISRAVHGNGGAAYPERTSTGTPDSGLGYIRAGGYLQRLLRATASRPMCCTTAVATAHEIISTSASSAQHAKSILVLMDHWRPSVCLAPGPHRRHPHRAPRLGIPRY